VAGFGILPFKSGELLEVNLAAPSGGTTAYALPSTILITLLLAVPAMPAELFRYRGAAKDGGTLDYVFEAGEQNSPHAITKEKAAEIAADFMTTFYHVQIGALETQEFRTQPVPVLARLLFRHDQGATATNVLCRSAAGQLLSQGWRSMRGADLGGSPRQYNTP
jgi:hypothetical protein